MMIKSMYYMMKSESFTNIMFFDTALYQLPLMQQPMVVQWPTDINSFVFASHTSIISKDLIENELQKCGKLENIQQRELNVLSDIMQQVLESKGDLNKPIAFDDLVKEKRIASLKPTTEQIYQVID